MVESFIQPSTERSRAQRGFVLVATLWFLAIITIVASYFANRVANSVESARQLQNIADAAVDIESTRAAVLFHFATDGFSVGGLGRDPATAIALDNRLYQGLGSDIVRLQDSRGLLNLNFVEPALISNLLSYFSVPVEKHNALIDALADYTDIDDFRRLNGAESAEYRAANLPPSPNEWLTTPLQLRSVFGWHKLTELWQDQKFLSLLTIARVNGFNPGNAAPDLLLALAGKENEPIVADIVKLRAAAPEVARLKAFALIQQRSGGSDGIMLFPGYSIRISQYRQELP